MFSTGFTSFSVLFIFPLLNIWKVLDAISSNIYEVLSINLFARVFVLGEFYVHHNDWLTYFGGTVRPCELFYNFSISNDLSTRIPGCDSHSLALLD